MRAVPGKTVRAPDTSTGLHHPGPRDPEAREGGYATHAPSGACSEGRSAPSPAAPGSSSIPRLTAGRHRPGHPRRTPGRAHVPWANTHHHCQEGEP